MTPEFVSDHYEKNRKRLLNRIKFAVGSDAAAEDVLHTAYERVLRYAESFNGENFDNWHSLIVRNAIRDHLAEENGYAPIDLDEFDFEGSTCSGYIDKINREILSLIDKKEPAIKEILLLHFKFGYAPVDISAITEYKYPRCHITIKRFRDELKELYQ